MAYEYSTSRTGMYRSRDGILLGVCRGLAEYFDLSVFCLRAIVGWTFILTGFFPVVIRVHSRRPADEREPAYHY